MRDLKRVLMENGINFTTQQFGNSTYFNNGFSISGILVSFDYERNHKKVIDLKRKKFLEFLKNSPDLIVGSVDKAGLNIYFYTVFFKTDYLQLVQHEKKVASEVKKFWENTQKQKLVTAL